jgi:hypothetical protein
VKFDDVDLAAVGHEIRQQHARIRSQIEHHHRITPHVPVVEWMALYSGRVGKSRQGE